MNTGHIKTLRCADRVFSIFIHWFLYEGSRTTSSDFNKKLESTLDMNFTIVADWKSQPIAEDRILRSTIDAPPFARIEEFLQLIGYSVVEKVDESYIRARRGSILGSLFLWDTRRVCHEIRVIVDEEFISVFVTMRAPTILTSYDQRVFKVEIDMLEEFLKSGLVPEEPIQSVLRQKRWADFYLVGGLFFLFTFISTLAIVFHHLSVG